MATRTKPDVLFKDMVLANKHRLPITIKATEGVYSEKYEISNGDVLQVLDIKDDIIAISRHKDTKAPIAVRLSPFYEGGFQIVLKHGLDHVYSSVEEIAQAFPPIVRVLANLTIGERTIRTGDRLKLIRIVETNRGKFLHCIHKPAEMKLILPFNMKGKFSPKNDDTIYTLNELKEKMPILVQRENNFGFAIRNKLPAVLRDLEDTIQLTKYTMVQAVSWDDPGESGIYDFTSRKELTLPIDFPITVVSMEERYEQYGLPEDLFDLARRGANKGNTLFVSCCDKQKALDHLDLPQDVTLMVHGIGERRGLICNGKSSNLLIPVDYNKTTLFKMLGQEFVTPYDLWKAKHMGLVKATETCRAPSGFPDAHSIYKNDEVQLVSKPTDDEEVDRLVGCERDIEEIDVIHVDRKMSITSPTLGPILIPSYMKVHFREPPRSLGKHCIYDIVTKFSGGNFPLQVEMSSLTRGASLTADDNTLIDESPLKIVAECTYRVAYVTIFDPLDSKTSEPKEAKEVPDFMKLNVRMMRQKFQVTPAMMKYREPTPRVFQLTLKQYSHIYNPDDDDDGHYETIKINPNAKQEDPPLPPQMRRECPIMPHHIQSSSDDSSRDFRPKSQPTLPVPEKADQGRVWSLAQRFSQNPNKKLFISLQQRYENQIMNPYSPTERQSPISQENQCRVPPPVSPKPNSTARDKRYSDFDKIKIPTVRPPADGNISEFDSTKLAGLFQHLDLGKQTVETCIFKQIDGLKLCDMFASMEDADLKTELVLQKESHLFSIKHFVSSSLTAKNIPKVRPPEDGNIRNFNFRQIAGLMKYFEFEERAITNCLSKQINGETLCDMAAKYEQDDLKQLLAVKSNLFFALMYFIKSSMESKEHME